MSLTALAYPGTRPHLPAMDDAQTAAALAGFHPALARWFEKSFPAATEAQARAWPLIRAARSTLVSAPTGSGKTLTAFLAAIDELVREGLARGGALPDETMVVYVSPLKALSNDIRINLQMPLAGIAAELQAMGLVAPEIRTAVRTGDTTQQERTAMRKRAAHILVTTPESLYVLLGSASGRAMLATTRSVIVDEIHAIAGSKRGSHLALSLARLEALCDRRLTRIGLSATQKPIEAVARFLVGNVSNVGDEGAGPAHAARDCAIVDVGHVRARDLALELPPVPLEAIMANDVWERVYDRLADLVAQHSTTLVFVNTRRMAERAARHLTERLGKAAVAAHHGSLAKEHRLDAEQRLKRGELRVLIATASLELGIDIGDVELVCQLGSPHAIAAFLQRVGRAGHQVGGTPKGRLFPSSREDLVECAALLDCVRRGELDTLVIPRAPLDVLAQHIVAELACREWSEDALLELIRGAEPYGALEREQYTAVLRMLAEGFTSRHGARGAYIHRDAVSRSLRGRRGGGLTALTSGGTIPDNADYTVLLEPQALTVGTVNEDFAVESLAGDVFQLGNTSYRILRIEAGRVRVENAQGQPPNIPFWLGEAPGRSDELSMGVARLRARVDSLLGEAPASAPERPDPATPAIVGHLPDPGGPAIDWLVDTVGLGDAAARQIIEYLGRARAILGALPTRDTLIMERFFDESGGTQLVIHTPYGSRINRAWGLALRKRFCRTFNVELQAAATDDAIVLSLSTSHSFVLDDVWRFLHSNTAEHVLIQAVLDAPLFGVRWRWNATTALALPRFSGGRKVAPQLQRMKSEDLLATVFPDQAACLENVVGERELPRHPLVDQTIDDCLHEAMDTEGWLALLRRIEAGEVRLIARDLPAPSPLAAEILNARPYAFLDDAPLEERRTQAVLNRRWAAPESPDELGQLDAEAIAAVRGEAWPLVRDADEMQEALQSLACVSAAEAQRQEGWPEWLADLARSGRATRLQLTAGAQAAALWLPVERLDCLRALHPGKALEPALTAPAEYAAAWSGDEAAVEVVRARLSGFGPLPVGMIAEPLGLPAATVSAALGRLEAEGYVMRGRFDPAINGEQWCERHLLARIHRYTVKRLRREIEPVERRDFMRFLFDWQHLAQRERLRGEAALAPILEQMEGFQAAASAWEEAILPARLDDYAPGWLDELCRSGKFAWTRLTDRARATGGPVRGTPVVLLPRRRIGAWNALLDQAGVPEPSARAGAVRDVLARHGAMFFDELLTETRVLPMELENALGELVALGLVNADSFAGLRALVSPAARRSTRAAGSRHRRARSRPLGGMDDAGRWALLRRNLPATGVSHGSADPGQHGDAATEARPEAQRAAPGRAAEPPVPRMQPKAAATRRAPLDSEALEHVVMTLLRRYGVLFWRLLEREAQWLPPWRDLLRALHRLEARGEIRGGRFVNGLSGEQFALPEAVPLLREVRRRPDEGALVCVSGADPLNLIGTMLPGEKVPALAANRVIYRDGVPIATLIAGKSALLLELDEIERDQVLARLAPARSPRPR